MYYLFSLPLDMNRSSIDDQSVVTYLMMLNKSMSDAIPELPSAIVELKRQVMRGELIRKEKKYFFHEFRRA